MALYWFIWFGMGFYDNIIPIWELLVCNWPKICSQWKYSEIFNLGLHIVLKMSICTKMSICPKVYYAFIPLLTKFRPNLLDWVALGPNFTFTKVFWHHLDSPKPLMPGPHSSPLWLQRPFFDLANSKIVFIEAKCL